MKHLFRSVRVVDAASPHDGQVLDLRLEDGLIIAMGADLSPEEGEELVQAEGLCVSPGWFDHFAHAADPGEEHKEDLHSIAAAAANGGFTAIALVPNTTPPLHAKSEMEYIRGRSEKLSIALHPYGAVSRHLAGTELTEMHDMRAAGAIAFSEGHRPLRHTGLLLRALRYVQPFDGLIVNLPLDLSLAGSAGVHEGIEATQLGMPGIPGLAEALMVQRDLSVLAYAGGRLHFPVLSSHRSVELLREARANGLAVSGAVAGYQLLLDDSSLAGYDANVKVMPPLRAKRDREALVEAVLDKTLTSVCSHHHPQHEDDKKVEFEYAAYGMAGVETTFAALRTALGERAEPTLISDLLGRNPRALFGLHQPLVKEGEAADLTFFQPDAPWTPSPAQSRSKARNNPFFGQTLKGRVLGVYARGRWQAASHAQAGIG